MKPHVHVTHRFSVRGEGLVSQRWSKDEEQKCAKRLFNLYNNWFCFLIDMLCFRCGCATCIEVVRPLS